MIRVAVIGAGHWGPNLVRNFDNKQRSEVRWVVDQSEERLASVRSRFPEVRLSTDAADAINDKEVDAVVIATPTVTHYELTRRALEQGKHVLVEKPLTDKSETARQLVELSKQTGKVLLVGHVFLYNPAVRLVKQYLAENKLGRVFYLSSQRTNLGPIRADVNAAWDLAAQDLSIFNYWLGAKPIAVSARGGTWINAGIEDAVFCTLRYPNDVLAHFHVSWLNPNKTREITVVAEHRMLTYDDMQLTEPIRVYDKHVENSPAKDYVDTFASFRSVIRDGDIHIPRVSMGEPLRNECMHFLDCIETGSEPLTNGQAALEVVETLEAASRSIASDGKEERV